MRGIRQSAFVLFVVLTACTSQPESVKEITVVPTESPPSHWWKPAPGLTWQWQLDEEVDTTVDAKVYDIDLYVDQSVIDQLHASGIKVICYISVGSWENWRPDADQFLPEVLGKKYEGWPGERWLDIRQIDTLAPIMRARLDLCAAKGFDGVEPDNIDIYQNDTGFPLSYQDQLNYALWLANEAHNRGLAIGLKNCPDMVGDALDSFDFAITEDGYYFSWIEKFDPFIRAGKPVFAAEYTDTGVDFSAACAYSRQHNMSLILKNRILTAFRDICR